MSKFSMRLAAVIAASTVSVAGAGFAAPALAQEAGVETTPSAPAAAADLVDPNATVTLNIHKYEGEPEPGNTGAPKNPDALKPLDGAQFVVEKVQGVDLTTQAGWAKAAEYGNYTVDQIKALPADKVGETLTTSGGLATFTAANGQGLYRVTEQSRTGYTTAQPFLIALPYSNGDGKWTYTRDVYPKNQKLVPSKQVDDSAATIGTDLKYTINAPVPASDLTTFKIEDKLVQELTLKTDGIKVAAKGVDLQAGTDYNIDTANNTLTVTFTEAGMEKLEKQRVTDPALKVTVDFAATVKEIPAGGVITNTATINYPNGATVTTDGDGPTSTTFGTLTINKTSNVGDKPLAGAVFELYQCVAKDGGGYTAVGDPLSVASTASGNPQKTLTTSGGDNAKSTATGFGVPIKSYAAVTGDSQNNYCVLETKAPDGYVRNPELQHVEINEGDLTLTATVENQKNTIINKLPATGAWGILLVFLVGLLLLARGLYTSYKDNRAQA